MPGKRQSALQGTLDQQAGEKVLHFDAVLFKGEQYYLALSRHGFCLFRDPHEHGPSDVTPLRFKYCNIVKITLDEQQHTLFSISVTSGHSSKNQELVLECSARDRIVESLTVQWRTETTMSRWMVADLQPTRALITDTKETVRAGLIEDILSAEIPPKYKFVRLRDYFYWIPEEYQAVDDPNAQTQRAIASQTHSLNGTPIRFTVRFIATPLKSTPENNINLKSIAESYARSILEHKKKQPISTSNAVFEKEAIFKQDKSIWEAHETIIETNAGLIAIVAARRKFLPPDALHHQDFVFLFDVPSEYGKEKTALVKGFHEVVHSLNTLPQGFVYNKLEIQARLDNLEVENAEFYQWALWALKMRPNIYSESVQRLLDSMTTPRSKVADAQSQDTLKIGDLFIFSVAKLCPSARPTISASLPRFDEFFSHLSMNPIEAIQTLNSLRPTSDNLDNLSWEVRVSLYLTFLCRSTVLNDSRDLISIMIDEISDSPTPLEKNVIVDVLNYLLHFRPSSTAACAYQQLEQQILNSQRDATCQFNELVFVRLLQSRFLQHTLSKSAFSLLITRALRNSQYDTVVAICNSVLSISDVDIWNLFCSSHEFVSQIIQALQYDDETLQLLSVRILQRACESSAHAVFVLRLILESGKFKYLLATLVRNSSQISHTIPIARLLNALVRVAVQASNDPKSGMSLSIIIHTGKMTLKEKLLRQSDLLKNLTTILSKMNVRTGEEEDQTSGTTAEQRHALLSIIVRTLWVLVSTDDSLCFELVEMGTIPTLVAFLNRKNSCFSNEVVQNVAGLLLRIADLDDHHKLLIAQCDAIEFLVKHVLQTHMSLLGQNKHKPENKATAEQSPNPQNPSAENGDKALIRNVAALLCSLSQSEENREILKEISALQTIEQLQRHFGETDRMVEGFAREIIAVCQ